MNTTTIHDLPATWRADPHANAEGCARQLEEVLADSLDPLHLLQALCDRKDAKIASLTAERDEARVELAAAREPLEAAYAALRMFADEYLWRPDPLTPLDAEYTQRIFEVQIATLTKLQPFIPNPES